MPEIVITHPSSDQDLRQLREIFFESSTKKEFSNDAEKESFFWKYVGYYLTHHPELVYLAKNDSVLGYCLGTANSLDEDLFHIQPHLKVFEEFFKQFPAHFHINCRFDARGMGIGSKLLAQFESELVKKGVPGVHLMTSVLAPNRAFYLKAGYRFESEKFFHGNSILFMGKAFKNN
jgi:ribosomal protein S18 acetylase RimI-like enzyme